MALDHETNRKIFQNGYVAYSERRADLRLRPHRPERYVHVYTERRRAARAGRAGLLRGGARTDCGPPALLYVSRSFFGLKSSPRMVAISPCMNAHGTAELASGHFSPLGQYTCERTAASEHCERTRRDTRRRGGEELTSEPAWRLMESREHGKQNLWWGWLGHCTKCVSSRRSWQRVHLRSGAGAGAAASAPSPASDDETDVVEDTCRDPDDRRPPFDPVGPQPVSYVLVRIEGAPPSARARAVVGRRAAREKALTRGVGRVLAGPARGALGRRLRG